MSFPFSVELSPGMEKDFGTRQAFPLGAVGYTFDGRKYKYCKAGSTALSPGLLNTYLTTPSVEETVTVAHAIGTTTVHVTIATIAIDDFKDGYLLVNQGTGIGEVYKIKGNTATDDPGAGLVGIDFFPADGLKTAWVIADTDVEVFKSPYGALIVNPVDAQQKPVCVANVLVTAANYFWGQVSGYCALLMDMSAASGLELDEKAVYCGTNSGNAGQGMTYPAAAGATGLHAVGYLVEEADIATDGDAVLVYLQLD